MYQTILPQTCDHATDDQGNYQHLEHPHEDITREGYEHDGLLIVVFVYHRPQGKAEDASEDNTGDGEA